MLRSVCAVLVMVLGCLVSGVAAPAWACGCGAYIPDKAGASVVDERAMVAWDGKTQDILMSFNVSGSSDKAAWVMPVPSAAKVTLGDTEVFDELARLTAPRVEYRDSWWPTFTWLLPGAASSLDTAGAPGGAVNVLGRQRIGPFDVTRLAANDPSALATWLADKGFPRPDGLEANLAPYIADHWEIVAIQLAPAQAGESLTGDLQPLRLTFASDKLVYPMRLSRSATTPQTVNLYVLADHRMDPQAVPVAGQKPSLEFAGRVEHADVSPALADYVGDGVFLTQWNDYINQPELIDGDYVFEPAASDTPFQHVIYRTRDRGDITGLILLAVLASAVVVFVVVLTRRRLHAR
ncbi:DUF2330 domain-containing protein [Mycolicibacterium moriokaense]|uniref:DUF2330 domain-containing protein n=1 Tax=Mycolicibacterium moriokaense TaxID=39691 RepID=A0A318HIC8_9MYCO|nr:DUF2330 domain-containing protein [Mycolicibacterium moriokaense]PXX09787.1 hypothetical protein C8E89_105141 [Mycolicibacterium moriokaense]